MGCHCHPPKHAGNVLNHGRHSCGQNTVQSAPGITHTHTHNAADDFAIGVSFPAFFLLRVFHTVCAVSLSICVIIYSIVAFSA